MGQENGKGTVKLVFLICLILIVVFFLARYVLGILNKEKVKNFQADLLLVQAKVEIVKGKYILNNEQNPLKGTKLNELTEEFNITDFIEKNVISTEEYEKYYILNSVNLEEMDLKKLVNKYAGYFIVNYENFDVIYTLGYENENGLWCYKLSDLNKMPEEEKIIPAVSTPAENAEETENTTENNAQNENSETSTENNTSNEITEDQTNSRNEQNTETAETTEKTWIVLQKKGKKQ